MFINNNTNDTNNDNTNITTNNNNNNSNNDNDNNDNDNDNDNDDYNDNNNISAFVGGIPHGGGINGGGRFINCHVAATALVASHRCANTLLA